MKIKVSISRDGYSEKPKDFMPGKCKSWKNIIRFYRKEIELKDFLLKILEGHSYCNLFNEEQKIVKINKYNKKVYSHYKDGSLSCSGKADQYFEGSQIITLDVDGTKYNDPWLYYDALLIKPTFVYTTFSDKQVFLNEKQLYPLRKFRCCWVFDKVIDNIFDYKILCAGLYKMIYDSTYELPSDDCGEKPSQLFHGTKLSAEWRLNENLIYTPNDFKYWTDKVKISEIAPVVWKDPNMIDSMENLDYQTFTHLFSTRYTYWYSTIRWNSDDTELFKKHGPEDFKLINHFGKNEDDETKWVNGQHRRNRIAQTARELLIMRPEATPDQVLYALYIWTNKFIEINEDITVQMLKNKVEAAFHLREDEEKWNDIIKQTLSNPNRKRYLCESNPFIEVSPYEVRKQRGLCDINEEYNPELSVYQNYELMKQNGFKVGLHHLYTYCEVAGIETNPNTKESLKMKQIRKDKLKIEKDKLKIEKLIGQGILDHIQPGLGLNKQLGQLREKGFKLSQELLITIKNIYHL